IEIGRKRRLMKRKTPQEKKTLSYAKDCRNVYGENDKTSRVSIRRNKTFPTRAFRKNINDILQGAVGAIDLEKAEVLDVNIRAIKRRRWKKSADMPLGKIVKERLEAGERPIRRKLKGAMRNIVKKEVTEYILTKNGWMTKKR
ncbi:MAG: hypothetical protein ACR2N3_11655, partial [Pyrinomonadaceae bacterium]